jgi:hypothetical protein
VIFVGGSEVAVIDEPRLLEVVRTDPVTSPAHAHEAFTTGALTTAEAGQASNGGTNPRFGPIFDESAGDDLPPATVATCAIITDRPALAAAVTAALEARGVACSTIAVGDLPPGFAGAAEVVASAAERVGPLDAVVVALAGRPAPTGATSGWEQTLAEHTGIVEQIHADAGWARAVADHAAGADRPVRLVTLTDAVTAGGRSRAQASAQLARAARRATGDRVAAFAVSVEMDQGDGPPIGELVAHLLCSPETPALSGAELVAGPGWFGLRSHPRPGGSVTFGGPAVPDWLDATLRSITR